MNTKKIAITGILGATLSIGAGVTPTPPNYSLSVASAHFMSSAEEHSIGQNAVTQIESEYETMFDEDIAEIQKRLVESNPTYLNMNDGVHKRWLSPMKLYHSDNPNAFMLPGGYSYMADSMVNFMNTYQNNGYTNSNNLRPLNGSHIYNTSSVAFVMGHEFGHWAGKDHLESYDKQFGLNLLVGIFGGQAGSVGGALAQSAGVNLVDTLIDRQMSFNQEKGADEWGLKFLENVPEYSTGGALTKFYRFMKLEEIRYPDGNRPKNFRNPHPDTEKRFERVADYINKSSNGRVSVNSYGNVFLDGVLLDIPSRMDVADVERSFYIAGQIAAAIKKDIFHRENLSLVAPSESKYGYNPNIPSMSYVMVSSRDGSEVKILDLIAYDKRRLYEENLNNSTYGKAEIKMMDQIIGLMEDYDNKHPRKK